MPDPHSPPHPQRRPTRIIALMNQKGGVGKTTTTVNLGATLAEAGRKVCLIDLDPQCHLTINYGVEPTADTVSIYNVLVEERSVLEALHKVDDRIALIPSHIDLAAAEIELVSVLGREKILKERIESAELDFDYILMDCPPSLGLLTINALAVAGEVIIPMQPHFLALQGVGKLLETVHLVSRRMNPALKVAGVVLTMFDSQTKLSNEVVSDLNSFIESAKGKPLPWAQSRIFNSKIRRNIKLAESPSFGKTILKYDPLSNGAVDYRNLAREILSMEPGAAPYTPAPLELQSAIGNRQSAIPKPKPVAKPKLAKLVSPEEAARLKAARVPEVVGKPEPDTRPADKPEVITNP
jgi:chromosome partitioning protein